MKTEMSAAVCVVVLACVAMVDAKFYKSGDQIDISVNTVRPFNNPAETYSFYSLPFCLPVSTKSEAELEDSGKFGDALAGGRRKPSAYEIFFRSKSLLVLVFGRY
jgi:hypothetical protein